MLACYFTVNLNKEHKQWLLDHARSNISLSLGIDAGMQLADPPPELSICCGAFVSVYVEEKLRGCLGSFSEDRSLVDTVERMARAAATEDHRFSPVLPGEFGDMEIEISVLTPRKAVYDIKEIVPGKHGIYIRKGDRAGTFLPQVAAKQGWDLEQFLGYCSRDKAGLGWDGWRDAELYTYEAHIFRS